MEISTSILSVDEKKAIETFYDVEVAKTDYFHIDVMDGKFVKKDTSGIMLEYATTLKHITNVPLDVHLMVENVQEYIENYITLEANIITVHYESFNNKQELLSAINYIKQNGCKVGLSIKPGTNIDSILEYLPYINIILIMTVEPGEGRSKINY